MSFDRVLPRPVALYDDPASRLLHRPTSSLLEHKIMNDRNRVLPLQDISIASSEVHRSKEPDSCSTALSQMQLSVVNREQNGQNGQLPVSFTAPSSRQNTPTLVTVESASRDRSGSGSPTRAEAAREAASQFCLCQPDPKIPRPRNAFILYRQHYQAAVVAQNPGLANPEISKIIGEQWRALPAETKEEWKALAAAEKARHQQQYPDYRYQPRRFGRDSYARNGTMSNGNQIGSTICNRCGGRLMNPPSTPHTPLTATVPPLSSRSLDSLSPHPSSSRANGNGNSKPDRRPTPMHILNDSDRRNQWREPGTAPLEAKRRRLNGSPFQNMDSPDTESYSLSSQQQTYGSRPGIAYFRSHADLSSNGHMSAPQPRHDGENYYDPSLTLPPLIADGTSSARIQTDTVMTIPVLNKIKVLAKISPPLSEQDNFQSRGVVIAIDGHHLAQVKVMLKYLGQLLMDNGKYIVRVFEGPDILARKGSTSGEMGDATVDYLNVISAWHRISDEIVQFISGSPRSSPQTANGSKSSSRIGSPQSGIEMLSAGSSPSPPTTVPSTTATSPSPVPIALVPRYQLTTADAFACSIPINDRYEFLDHWQWMASLWRACIGPDVTVHIRECDREELERHGSGNPVEVRLNEARTLIVRRLPDPTKDIEEKALKRVGFEIEDFLTR